jgi:hypothetical protein
MNQRLLKKLKELLFFVDGHFPSGIGERDLALLESQKGRITNLINP